MLSCSDRPLPDHDRRVSALGQHHGDEVGDIRSYQETTHHTRDLPIPDTSQQCQMNDDHHG